MVSAQKFEDSLGDNPVENAAMFVDLITQAGGVEADKEEILQYINFTGALTSYQPGRKFDGITLAVKTTDPSNPFSLMINTTWPNYEKVQQ